MGFVIGQATSGAYSTWAQLRCPLIGAYDQWHKYVGPGTEHHNLVIDSGFHPDEGLFVRVASWPFTFDWTTTGGDPLTQYSGPIVGFFDGNGLSESFFSIGSYQWELNDAAFTYTSAVNLVDLSDITDSFVGLTVTYSSGTFAITSDALEADPPFLPWFGQDIGLNAITSVTDIDTFTAF